jgi:hypothetical protein
MVNSIHTSFWATLTAASKASQTRCLVRKTSVSPGCFRFVRAARTSMLPA